MQKSYYQRIDLDLTQDELAQMLKLPDGFLIESVAASGGRITVVCVRPIPAKSAGAPKARSGQKPR
ncbi:MAG TPA: hypothetical protein VNP04_07250 [Alphaproteobacteria bacterium]|nr:hypothetical protein [Alphaproteobacteria bacterium]